MRKGRTDGQAVGAQTPFNPDEDRFQSLSDAISSAREHEDFPTGQVEKFEIVCHASGEVTWRVWAPRAEEPLGGYVPAPSPIP
jgi:hypothetical protein